MNLGVEIGGTKLQVGVCDRHGRVLLLLRDAVDRSRGRAGILAQLQAMIPRARSQFPVRAIGVGFGGPVDAAAGRVVVSHHVAGWSGYRLRAWFEKRFGVPALIENDSNCAAFAEATLGAGKGNAVVLYSNIGTGIGGGLVIGGRLYSGKCGAMEIGHLRFDRETVESQASGLAIERKRVTLEHAARRYGEALAAAITLLNPDIVVIGGGVSLADAKFWRPLRAAIQQNVFPPYRRNHTIVPAKLGESVVVVGAAQLAGQLSNQAAC